MEPMPELPEWDDRAGFGLVMPFTMVMSKGGPYEDKSFTAGYQMGEIAGKLEMRSIAASTYLIYVDLIDQLDLIAMRFNYKTEVLYQDEYWVQVGVMRIDGETPPTFPLPDGP
jgi:hypothetical protein